MNERKGRAHQRSLVSRCFEASQPQGFFRAENKLQYENNFQSISYLFCLQVIKPHNSFFCFLLQQLLTLGEKLLHSINYKYFDYDHVQQRTKETRYNIIIVIPYGL